MLRSASKQHRPLGQLPNWLQCEELSLSYAPGDLVFVCLQVLAKLRNFFLHRWMLRIIDAIGAVFKDAEHVSIRLPLNRYKGSTNGNESTNDYCRGDKCLFHRDSNYRRNSAVMSIAYFGDRSPALRVITALCCRGDLNERLGRCNARVVDDRNIFAAIIGTVLYSVTESALCASGTLTRFFRCWAHNFTR